MVKTPLGYSISIEELIHPESLKIIVISSATGVVKEFYKHFAEFLYSHKLSVVTFDYGGIGESKPISLRNFNTSAHKWGINDFETVLNHVVKTYPEKELILIGHSIGGQLIGLTPSAVNASKIILVGTQSGYYKFWPKNARIKMLIAWKAFFPMFNKIMGYIPTNSFTNIENLPGGMAIEWAKWCLSPNYLFDFIEPSQLYFENFKQKIFSYSTDKDPFASSESTDWISSKFSNSKMERVHLKPEDFGVKNIGHFGYFQRRCSHSVWPELLSKI